VLRRLGPDRLLISRAMGDSGYVQTGTSPWYSAQETLAALGPRGVTAWNQLVSGRPALLPNPSSEAGSGGFLLPNNQLFWTAWATNRGQLDSYNLWLDLATGAVLPVPPKRSLEGACRP
jgi:hypothetical protein